MIYHKHSNQKQRKSLHLRFKLFPNLPPIGTVVDSQRGVDEFVVPAEENCNPEVGIETGRKHTTTMTKTKNGDITDEEFCITQKRCDLERKLYS